MSGTFGNVSRAWGTAGSDIDYASRKYSGPKDWRTANSSTVRGVTTFDPTIRALREQSLATGQAGLDDFLASSGNLRGRYEGNQSAYRQAILDPLREQYATRRGELQRNIGMRGMAGSSFGDQAMTSFDTSSMRNLGNAAAEAEMRDLMALQGIDQSRLSARQGFAQQQADVANANMAQELAGLGLSQQQIAQYMQNYENAQRRRLEQARNIGQASQNFHTLVTDWGDFTRLIPGGSAGAAGAGGGAG